MVIIAFAVVIIRGVAYAMLVSPSFIFFIPHYAPFPNLCPHVSSLLE